MLSLADIAQRTQGRIVGDERIGISGVGSLAHARSGDLAFFSNPRLSKQLANTQASAVLISESAVASSPVAAVVVDNPQLAFAQIAAIFDRRMKTPIGVHESAQIAPTARLGRDVRIGPFVSIEAHCIVEDGVELCANVSIGAYSLIKRNTSIRENAVIYHDVKIGARCTVHANATIGADGFGIVPDATGTLQEIPQVGGVTVGDDVLIGACATIDRGTLDDTLIHDNVKLDNHVHIGHNCEIGAHSILCGCTGVAGSVSIGQYCVIGGGVGIAGEGPLRITDGVQVGAMTYISRDITEAGRYSGSTLCTDNRSWRRNALRFNELDAMAKRLARLERKLERRSSAEQCPLKVE